MNNRGEILRYLEAEIRSGTPAHTLRLLHEELVRLLRVLARLPSNDPARESAHRVAADIVEELVRALAAGSGSPFEDLLSAYASLGTELAATGRAPSPARLAEMLELMERIGKLLSPPKQ
ncbi:MAG: hypothetical protein HYY13_12810 [Nitrospirae bacterium]|nr:hypothetical protein [Nitrospirota bacterium]